MTAHRKIIIDLEVISSASEASVCSHADGIVQEIAQYVRSVKDKEWLRNINLSWDETVPVEIIEQIQCIKN